MAGIETILGFDIKSYDSADQKRFVADEAARLNLKWIRKGEVVYQEDTGVRWEYVGSNHIGGHPLPIPGADWAEYKGVSKHVDLEDTPAYVAKSLQATNADGTALENTSVFYDAANTHLGINIDSPLAKLHIKGAGTTSGTLGLIVENGDQSKRFSFNDEGTAASSYNIKLSDLNMTGNTPRIIFEGTNVAYSVIYADNGGLRISSHKTICTDFHATTRLSAGANGGSATEPFLTKTGNIGGSGKSGIFFKDSSYVTGIGFSIGGLEAAMISKYRGFSINNREVTSTFSLTGLDSYTISSYTNANGSTSITPMADDGETHSGFKEIITIGSTVEVLGVEAKVLSTTGSSIIVDTALGDGNLNQITIHPPVETVFNKSGVLIHLVDHNDNIYTKRPTYADNAAAIAAGLDVGYEYQTTTGEIRVVI